MADSKEHFHMDRTFNIGHVLTTITLVVTALVYVTTMDKRMAVLETKTVAQADVIVQLQQAQRDGTREVRDEIRGLRGELMDVLRKRGEGRQ